MSTRTEVEFLEEENAELRALLGEILGCFHYLHQDFMECDTTPDEYAGWRERAGLDG